MPLSDSKNLNRVTGTLLLVTGAAALLDLVTPSPGTGLDFILLALAAGATLSALARQLPVQNVLLAASVAALVGAAAHGLSARTGIPLGPLLFTPNALPRLFQAVPVSVPLIWILAIFNSRGVARLGLRPWRKLKSYGWWLMGLTALLTTLFDLALEPYAVRVKRFWFWQPTKLSITWQGATPLDFLGWGLLTILILAFITPALIRKKPGEAIPPDFQPLALWLGSVAVFAAGAARSGLWPAMAVDLVLAGIVTGFAWRGARW
jgi:uncharacterized membrane protein